MFGVECAVEGLAGTWNMLVGVSSTCNSATREAAVSGDVRGVEGDTYIIIDSSYMGDCGEEGLAV